LRQGAGLIDVSSAVEPSPVHETGRSSTGHTAGPTGPQPHPAEPHPAEPHRAGAAGLTATESSRAVHPPLDSCSTSSTSTGASMGSTATPTAERACTPASPKMSCSTCEAPLITCG